MSWLKKYSYHLAFSSSVKCQTLGAGAKSGPAKDIMRPSGLKRATYINFQDNICVLKSYFISQIKAVFFIFTLPNCLEIIKRLTSLSEHFYSFQIFHQTSGLHHMTRTSLNMNDLTFHKTYLIPLHLEPLKTH